MNGPSHQAVMPSEDRIRRNAWVPLLLGLPTVAAVLYMGALTGFIRWEERAGTNAEYIRRAEFRNKIYAPVIWLKAHDPSGAVRAIVQWEYSMCHKQAFDPNRLP